MNVPPLSQAILLGIGVVKEVRAPFYVMAPEGPCGCAIGTALYAVGRPENVLAIHTTHLLWPWTMSPSNKKEFLNIAHEISTRHSRGESRESLAAWIATIEPLEPHEAAPAVQPATMEVGA